MNAAIVAGLRELEERYRASGDTGRQRAYARAIRSVENHGEVITSGEQAKKLRWIGDGIAGRIDAILGTTGGGAGGEQASVPKYRVQFVGDAVPPASEPRHHKTNAQPRKKRRRGREANAGGRGGRETNARRETNAGGQTQVSGETKKAASDKPRHLTPPGALPRAVADRFLRVLRRLLQHASPTGRLTLADAYRRGHSVLKELVVLVTDLAEPNGTARARSILNFVCSSLERVGILSGWEADVRTASVSGTLSFKDGHRLPVWLVCVAASTWACALLRYTGPHSVWRQLRAIAEERGCQLTVSGLFSNAGVLIPTPVEADVFRILGLHYLGPEQRGD